MEKYHNQIEENNVRRDSNEWKVMDEKCSAFRSDESIVKDENVPFDRGPQHQHRNESVERKINEIPDLTCSRCSRWRSVRVEVGENQGNIE